MITRLLAGAQLGNLDALLLVRGVKVVQRGIRDLMMMMERI